MEIEFKEEQKFTQWWLWLILIGIGVFTMFGLYKQLVLGEKFGDTPLSDTGLLISALLIFGLIVLFGGMRLKTEVNRHEIRITFFPFVKKRISWQEVKHAEVVNYGFVGGWGVRLWTRYGTVYNTKGSKGLALQLLNGKKLLIGTQKEAELKKVIEKMPL